MSYLITQAGGRQPMQGKSPCWPADRGSQLCFTWCFGFLKSWVMQLCFKGCTIGSFCHIYSPTHSSRLLYQRLQDYDSLFYLSYHNISNLLLTLSYSNHCIQHIHWKKNSTWREGDLLLTRCRANFNFNLKSKRIDFFNLFNLFLLTEQLV